MVQITHHYRFGCSEDNARHFYWKLDDGSRYDSATLLQMLKERKFPIKNITPRERVKELYTRSQRGLVSYEMLKLAELKSLVGQRGLAAPAGKWDGPWSFRTILERADDNVTFNRFTDLPPELRLQIYAHHFNSFDERDANIICQPPITAVSKSVREDSLPVFHSCCVPKADISVFPTALHHSVRTNRLLERTSPEQFGWIRKIEVNLQVARHCISLLIDICNKCTPVKVIYYPDRPEFLTPLTQECLDCLTSDLNALVRVMGAREGNSKLQASDLTHLHEKVDSILAQQATRA